MSTAIVTGWELEKHNNSTNEHKFYRVFVLGSEVITHWGRVRTLGQSKSTQRDSPASARDYALKQFFSKRDRGYEALVENFTFEVPTGTAWRNIGIAMHQALQTEPYGAQARAAIGVYEQFTDRAYALLGTVSNASLDELLDDKLNGEVQAMTAAFADINEQHSEAETAMSMLQSIITAKLGGG